MVVCMTIFSAIASGAWQAHPTEAHKAQSILSHSKTFFFLTLFWSVFFGHFFPITSEGKIKETLHSLKNGGNGDEKEYMELTKGVDKL